MVRMEPETVDLQRWPTLVAPTTGDANAGRHGVAREVRDGLRAAAPEIGIRVDFPDGSSWGPVDAQPVMVLVSPDDVWARIGRSSVHGLAEAYMAGEWTTLDLVGMLAALVPWLSRFPALDVIRRHTTAKPARKRRHGAAEQTDFDDYLPGELVALFTDETMSTSFGMFASGARTRHCDAHGRDVVTMHAPVSPPHRLDLGDAQRRAADTLLHLADVGAGTRTNVVPPGWGEVPLRAAERGAQVRCVAEQWPRLQVLGARFRAAGLGESIFVRHGSLAELTGEVDAMVSSHPRYAEGESLVDVLSLAARSLRPGGRLGIQIGIGADRHAPEIAELTTWRRAYIDERSAIALRSEVKDAFAAEPSLRLRGRVEFGQHAAHTARLWREIFAGHGRDAAAVGFDPVYRRMWHVHLAAAQAALHAGWVDAWQLLAARDA